MTDITDYDLTNCLVDRLNVERLVKGVLMERGATATDRVVFDFIGARTIFGFGKDYEQISVSQCVHGVKSKQGNWITPPTGLGTTAVKKSIKRLIGMGLLEDQNEIKLNGRRPDRAKVFHIPWYNLISLPDEPWLRPQSAKGREATTPSREATTPGREATTPRSRDDPIKDTKKETPKKTPKERMSPRFAGDLGAEGEERPAKGVIHLLRERPLPPHPCPKPFDSAIRAEALEEYAGISLYAYWRERYERHYPDCRVRQWVVAVDERTGKRNDKVWRKVDENIGAPLDRDPARVVDFLDTVLYGWKWWRSKTYYDEEDFAFIADMPKNPSINHILKHAEEFLTWDLHHLQSQYLRFRLEDADVERSLEIAEEYHNTIEAEIEEERMAA